MQAPFRYFDDISVLQVRFVLVICSASRRRDKDNCLFVLDNASRARDRGRKFQQSSPANPCCTRCEKQAPSSRLFVDDVSRAMRRKRVQATPAAYGTGTNLCTPETNAEPSGGRFPTTIAIACRCGCSTRLVLMDKKKSARVLVVGLLLSTP